MKKRYLVKMKMSSLKLKVFSEEALQLKVSLEEAAHEHTLQRAMGLIQGFYARQELEHVFVDVEREQCEVQGLVLEQELAQEDDFLPSLGISRNDKEVEPYDVCELDVQGQVQALVQMLALVQILVKLSGELIHLSQPSEQVKLQEQHLNLGGGDGYGGDGDDGGDKVEELEKV